MNISAKVLALAVALQMSGSLIANYEYVVINRQALLQKSKKGAQLRNELETAARELQATQQKMIAEIQNEEKELQKTLVAMNKDAQQAAVSKLQKKAKKVQGQIQEMTNEFNEGAEAQQKALDEDNLEVASAMLTEKKWGALVDINATLAVNPDLDVTPIVLARLDERFDSQVKVFESDVPAQNTAAPAA